MTVNVCYGAKSQMFGSYELLNNFSDWDENGEFGVGLFDTLFKKNKKDNYVSDEAENASKTDPVFSGRDNVQSVIYNSILTPDPRLAPYMGNDEKDYGPRSITRSTQNMPLFQKCRIKLMNKIRRQEEKSYLKELEKEKKQLEEYEKSLDNENNYSNVFYRHKKNSKPKDVVDLENKVQDIVIEEDASEVKEELSDVAPKTIPLKGKLKEVRGENVIVLDAKNIYYVEKDDVIIAENSASVKFPRQKITVTADKFEYSNTNNIVKAMGNVVINGGGHKIFSDYIQVNINEEEISIDKILADFPNFKIEAKNGISKDDTLYLYDGYLHAKEAKRLTMPSRMIRGVSPDGLVPVEENDKYYIQNKLVDDNNTTIFAERVYIDAKDDHDVISLKKAKIHYGKNKLFSIPSITAYTDKSHSVFEASYPELGTFSQLGFFAGPGFAFEVPHAGVMKIIPFLNYRKKHIGVGGAVRYRSANNFTEFAYGSASDVYMLKGYQYLDDNLTFRYGINSFMEDWFLGPRRPKYAAELMTSGGHTIHNSLHKGLNLDYRYLASLGYYQNSMYNINFENFHESNFGTLRGRYMAQIQQDLYKYYNRKNHTRFMLSALLQGSAAIYGNGGTQFIGRAGLSAQSQYKYWVQNISYFLSASQDGTPMQRFDAYRYGTSSVMILEAIRLCKFLSLAWSGMLTLSNDSPNNKMLQESSFMFIIGPDDFKVTLGYDYVRKVTYITLGVSLDTASTKLDYNVMEIKNPDKLGDDSEKIEELCPDFWLIPEPKAKTPHYQYAQVISIDESENRERID